MPYNKEHDYTLEYDTKEKSEKNWMDEPKYNSIIEWCRKSFIKTKTINKRHSCYGYKHWCEDAIYSYPAMKKSEYPSYVSESQIVRALESLGYETSLSRNGYRYANVGATEELKKWLENRGDRW